MDRGSLNGGASVVVDLSAHAATVAGTARARSRHLQLDSPPVRPLLDELEADLARFDGHPDTAEAFAVAGARARALAAAGGGDDEALRSAALEGVPDGGVSERGWIHSVPVKRWQQPYAALVARARPDCRDRALVFLEEAGAILAPVLERNMLLERNAARERALVDSGERRLLRLGYDLHDGPIQDLVALAADVRLAGSQVAEHVDGRAREVVAGRLDDLSAQIVELDRTLRELAQAPQPPSRPPSSATARP